MQHPTNLVVLKLISTEGSHAWFDATCSQSNKEQTDHGQSSGVKTQRHYISVCVVLLFFYCVTALSELHSHMEVDVVRGAVSVCICDIVDSTYSHHYLSQGVYDGQVNNSPVEREEEEGAVI